LVLPAGIRTPPGGVIRHLVDLLLERQSRRALAPPEETLLRLAEPLLPRTTAGTEETVYALTSSGRTHAAER
jgi:hypothetical protein